MGKLLTIGVICLVGVGVTTAVASAQTTAVGYGFVSPAFVTYEGESLAIFQAGGGGEARLGERVGIGVDLGFAAPWEELSDTAGTLSGNGTFYVKGTNRSRKTHPFVTGGYTMLFRDGFVNGVNVGVGVDRWMTDRVGMRFEFRDHIMMEEGESFHFWGPRISIVWRGK
jgi:hypothetical protein